MRHILDSITCVSHGINIFEISKLKYYEYRSYQPIIILLIILYFIRSASCFQYHLLWVLNLKTQKTSRPRWRWSPGRAPLGMSSPGRRTPWQRTPGGSTQLYWWSSSHTKQTKPFGEGFSHVVCMSSDAMTSCLLVWVALWLWTLYFVICDWMLLLCGRD